MNEKEHSETEYLIVRHLLGETTQTEEEMFQQWIAMSEENAQEFAEIKKAYELSGKHYNPTASKGLDIDVSDEWNRFEKNVEDQEKTVTFAPERSNNTLWLKIAAVILLVVVSGIVINYFASQGSEQVYQTAENVETVVLPDGSSVSLNRNSQLTFDKSFGKEKRGVQLKGEAFFDIEPNKGSPFVIKVNEAEVTVVGTSFNVRGYESGAELTVTVASGVVKFAPKQIDEEIELRAGEKGVFNRAEGRLESNQNDDVNFLAWKTRKIVLERNSLYEVANILNSVYGAEITISTDASACQVTATFENQSLDAVLNVLKSTLDLTYKITGNKIEITKAGC